MSLIGDIMLEPLEKILKRLEQYNQAIEQAEQLFKLDGILLEDSCKTQPQNLVSYNLLLQECKTIEYYAQLKLEEQEGRLYRKYIESGARALGVKELQMYVKSDPEYVETKSIWVEIEHTKRSLEAIVEAFVTLGWSLSNIVKIRVASMEHVIL